MKGKQTKLLYKKYEKFAIKQKTEKLSEKKKKLKKKKLINDNDKL